MPTGTTDDFDRSAVASTASARVASFTELVQNIEEIA